MPPALIALGSAAIGAGATVYGASQSRSAANSAQQAQDRAAQQQLAAQQQYLSTVQAANAPYQAGGLSAYDALLSRYGLSRNAATPGEGAPPANDGSAPTGSGVIGAQGFGGYGGGTNNAQYGTRPDPGAPFATGQQAPADANGRPDIMPGLSRPAAGSFGELIQSGNIHGWNSADPNAPTYAGLPNASYGGLPPRVTDIEAPQGFDAGSGPQVGDYLKNFQEDPGTAYVRQQALDGVNAGFAAKNMLRSGAAAKALQDRSAQLANQTYGDYFNRQQQTYNAARSAYTGDRSYAANMYAGQQSRADNNFNTDRSTGLNLYQYNTNRGDQNFNTDRQFQAGQDDTNTRNLFSLSNTGLQAAGNISGAAGSYANNTGNIYGNQADAASQAAYARANANNQMIGGLATQAGNLFGGFGTPQTQQFQTSSPYGAFGQATNTANANPSGFQAYNWPVF